ncbi:HTH domain-containing protein, partial [Anaerotruncus massiliensis (ex Liu et al. 2021)]
MSLKEELLRYLEEHREAPVSGQLLAERLSVSRAAVWKAVKSLEEEGHRITAATNRGYQLEAASDVLTAQGVRYHLRPAYRDCAVLVERRVGSTNTQVKKLAADGA